MLPKLTIFNLKSSDYKASDTVKLKQAITDKNPTIKSLVDDNKCFEIMFIKEDSRRPELSYAAAKVDHVVYDAIRAMKYQIFVDFGRCYVRDRFRIIQCYGCQKFGHVKLDCPLNATNALVCRFCSENHDGRHCPHKGNYEKYKCANCGLSHSSTYTGCSVLQNQVDFLASRTQGLERFAKNDLRRQEIIT